MKLLWIEVGRVYDDKAIALDLPSVVFGACKVLDLTSIFVEDDTQASSERGQREFVPVTFLCPVDNYLFAGLASGPSTDSNTVNTKLASPFSGMK